MSIYKCVLLLLFLTTTICAQPKAGTLKIKPYVFENDKKEKADAEFGTLLVPTVDNLRNFFLRPPTEMLSFFQQWQQTR